jgi:hypothetical protein
LNYRAYEATVASIAANIAKTIDDLDESSVKYGATNRINGASGHSHQIDVSVAGESAVYLVECKCWIDKVPVEAVLTLYGRICDIAAHQGKRVHGTIATTNGFQSGAKKVGDYFDINLVHVKSESEFVMYFKNSVWIGVPSGRAAIESDPPKPYVSGEDG